MVYCSNCGIEISEEANFCLKCGSRTPKGIENGVVPHWKEDLDKTLQAASKSFEEAIKKAREHIQTGVRDLGPELEQVRESLREVAEDFGEKLRSVGEDIRKRTGMARVSCSECGEKNMTYAKYCIKCGKEIE